MRGLERPQTVDAPAPAGSLVLPAPAASRSARRPTALIRSLQVACASAAERRRIFILLPFCVIAGAIAYRLWPGEPAAAVYGLLAMCALALAIAAVRHVAPTAVTATGLAAILGFALLPLHGALFGTVMLDRVLYGPFSATVERVIADDGESLRVLVSGVVPLDPEDTVPPMRLARLTLEPPVPLQPGDAISGTMRLYPVPGPIVPGGYDAQFTSYFDGIGAYGNVFGEIVVMASAASWDWRVPIEALRGAIAERVLAVQGERIGAIGVALINGDQSRITEQDREVMALAGLTHVLSISGLHLTLVAGAVFWLVRLALALLPGIALRFPIKKLAAICGLVAAVGYLLISGMAVPAIRSTLMLALVFGAMLAGRQALTMRNVAIAALVVLLVDPASVFSASFQLSFAAVVALIAAVELDRQWRKSGEQGPRTPWLLRIFVGAAITSLVAGGATALFTAYHFQQTAPLGLFGNVLATPLISFVMMPSALFGVLAMPFGLEAVPLQIMGWSIEGMLAIAAWVGETGQGFNPSPILAPVSLVLLLAGLAWLAFIEGPWRLVGPAAVVGLIFLVAQAPRPDMLIADDTQAIALRQDGAMTLIAGRTGTFATDIWSERYIEPIVSVERAQFCDEIGCVFPAQPYGMVATPRHPAAVREDCALATVIIARFPIAEPCRAITQVVDADDLDRGGAHALYWDPAADRFDIRPVIDDPSRPWRPQ